MASRYIDPVNAEMKQLIVEWAIEQYRTIPKSEMGDDWWNTYGQYDINIWTDDDNITRVTAYPYGYDKEAGCIQTDYSTIIPIGIIDTKTKSK